MKLSSPYLQLALASTVLLVALIACGFWYETLASESANVAGIQSQIDDVQQTAKRIASARAALSQIAGDEASVRAYFVSDANIVNFIDDLQARGQTLGATVTVLSVAAATAGTHSALDLSVSVKGSFDAVMRTIGAIEYAPYDVVMGAVTLSEQTGGTWLGTAAFTVGSAPVSLGGAPAATTTAMSAGASATTTIATTTRATTTAPASPSAPKKGGLTPTLAH